ncbi:MAG: D-alanine--poly(phosphoribitol) ligase, partial [Lachnospiraceae bacterium]|nr:D-alanine--poly(phosphoribitol) ligase [Lachnospiraceae bacterium]
AASSYQIYRTGDLAKRLPSGDLVFLGRKDSQVKRMGYRIDLAELERLAAACPQVKSCCCVQKADGRIVLYILGKNVGAFSSLSARVSALLRQSLPSYALPNRIILRDSLPSLPNGKIDRRRLREE